MVQADRPESAAAYIRRIYQVPAKRYGWVRFQGRRGKITGFDGAHLLVRLDGDVSPSRLHPTWQVEYLVDETRNAPKIPAPAVAAAA